MQSGQGPSQNRAKSLVFSLLWKTGSDGDAWADYSRQFHTDAAAAGKAGAKQYKFTHSHMYVIILTCMVRYRAFVPAGMPMPWIALNKHMAPCL